MVDDMGPLCCGKPNQSERFMEVCLLLLLSQNISHGYALLEQLKNFDIDTDQLNTSTLYRTLKKMEAAGAAASEWESGGLGPKRRVYHITKQGNLYLRNWIQVLKIRRARIGKLIESYEALQDANNQ